MLVSRSRSQRELDQNASELDREKSASGQCRAQMRILQKRALEFEAAALPGGAVSAKGVEKVVEAVDKLKMRVSALRIDITRLAGRLSQLGNELQDATPEHVAELVLGSDVTYEESCAGALCQTLAAVLAKHVVAARNLAAVAQNDGRRVLHVHASAGGDIASPAHGTRLHRGARVYRNADR